MVSEREIRHAHLFCGMGGFARGFNRGQARVGPTVAKFRCLGGIDVDAAAIRDFGRLAGVPGTMLDLFTREQYHAFHGRLPPPGWREATIADILAAFGNSLPDVVCLSAPCKGFSGLLSETRSLSPKYQALNQLALRGLLLALEAYKDDPIPVILFENVPRIATRGRHLVEQIVGLLESYGYACAETTHDCGELGGLAQSRKRWLLICRHTAKVPPFIYEPVLKPLRAVGDVLGRMLLPGDKRGGPMHRVPNLQWKTWMRLAFVKAGEDWRSLERLVVENGFLRDYAIAAEAGYHPGVLGVQPWDKPARTVTSESRPTNGTFSVVDPRYGDNGHDYHIFGVTLWNDTASTVTGQRSPGQGRFSVADPRVPRELPFRNVFRIVRWDEVSRAVTGGGHPTAGGINVADPRVGYGPTSHRNKLAVVDWNKPSKVVTGASQVQGGALSVADPRPARGWEGGKYRVTEFNEPAGTVIAGSTTGNGAFAVADPRTGLTRQGEDDYVRCGHYGVVPWTEPAGAVTGRLHHDNGPGNVADPRVQPNPTDDGVCQLPAADQRLVAVIRTLDDTWHRPFTTLELAALQGLVDPEEHLELDGLSDSAWRERIGNAVPSPAAEAIAGVIGTTLLLAWAGETFALGSTPIWVRPIAVALSLPGRGLE